MVATQAQLLKSAKPQETFSTARPCKSVKKATTFESNATSKGSENDQVVKSQFRCSVCRFYFSKKEVFQNHRLHKECIYCKEGFTCRRYFHRHVTTRHTIHETFKCTLCGTSYNKKSNFKRHLITKHPKLIPKLSCDKCNKFFGKVFLLKEHVERVHTNQYLNCKHCSAKFEDKSDFQTHVVKFHKSSNGSFKCEQCLKTFTLKGNLKKHILYTHEKAELPYQCEKCSGRFRGPTELKRHVEAVHNKVRLQCPYCNESLAFESNLKRHIAQVHTRSPMMFQCSYCECKPYINLSSLKCHIRVKHGISG